MLDTASVRSIITGTSELYNSAWGPVFHNTCTAYAEENTSVEALMLQRSPVS